MPRVPQSFLCTVPLLLWPAALVLAQSQSSSQQSPPPQQSQAQQPAAQPQTQEPTEQKPDSLAEASRKAKAKKAATAQGKVLTEDDLAGKKGGLSVVGSDNKKTSGGARTTDADGNYNPNGEDYWRSRSQPILDAIAATDQQIEQLKEDIKKYGSGGFDVQTGRNTTGKDLDTVYLHDRNGQIEQLQKRKAALQKQLADLEEEGRKAGAQPAWFR